MAVTFDPRMVSPRLPELPGSPGPSGSAAPSGGAAPSGSAASAGFAERLGEAVRATDLEQKQAEAASTALAEGRSDDLHGTMIALQRADVSLRLAANVRNRAIEAYREVMRMGA